MKILFVKLLLSSILIGICIPVAAQRELPGQPPEIVTFRFVPGDDMFYIPWKGNNTELHRLYQLVDEYRKEIISGVIPIYVDAYSASMRIHKTNLNLSFIRANRVKSELIVHKGLKEQHFITKNYAVPYQGEKDVVVVTLRIPVQVEAPAPQPEPEPIIEPQPEPVIVPEPEPVVGPEPVLRQTGFYPFAIRTNLLYDAFLTPTIGVEWRINPNVAIKLDGSWAHWGNEHGRVQKIWLISPEVRWYMGDMKRLYAGAGANIGEYNIYKYMIGGLFPDNTGYQGTIYSGGLTVGYQLPVCNRFAIDFNLGVGYTRFKYDSFRISKEVRVYQERNQSTNFWGPTQAGITLVWRLGVKNEEVRMKN